MTLNTNYRIRCRDDLKPYYHQRIQFIGYLKGIGLNQKIEQKIQHDHNALFVDVHALYVINDNPQKQIEIDIDLDHIHCQIQNLHLDDYLNQFVTFSAKINRYESTYNSKTEQRYGLDELILQTTTSIINLRPINQKYKSQLTIYQNMLINHLIKQLPKVYPERRLYAINEIKSNLYRFSTFTDRTNFLINTAEKLHSQEPLSNRKMKFFTEDPNEHLNIRQYETLKTDFSQLKHEYAQLKEQRIQDKIRYQSQLSKDQKIIQQQNKTIKFQQSVQKYLPKNQTNQPEKPLVNHDQLQALKNKFN